MDPASREELMAAMETTEFSRLVSSELRQPNPAALNRLMVTWHKELSGSEWFMRMVARYQHANQIAAWLVTTSAASKRLHCPPERTLPDPSLQWASKKMLLTAIELLCQSIACGDVLLKPLHAESDANHLRIYEVLDDPETVRAELETSSVSSEESSDDDGSEAKLTSIIEALRRSYCQS